MKWNNLAHPQLEVTQLMLNSLHNSKATGKLKKCNNSICFSIWASTSKDIEVIKGDKKEYYLLTPRKHYPEINLRIEEESKAMSPLLNPNMKHNRQHYSSKVSQFKGNDQCTTGKLKKP